MMLQGVGVMIESWLFFVLAAAALLGSPGPGIAALVAVGRSRGVIGGLRYFGAMQLGLAIAAGLTAAGLVAARFGYRRAAMWG